MNVETRIAYGYLVGRALAAGRPTSRTLDAWPSVPQVRPYVVAVRAPAARAREVTR